MVTVFLPAPSSPLLPTALGILHLVQDVSRNEVDLDIRNLIIRSGRTLG
jgi:hypothetical protein